MSVTVIRVKLFLMGVHGLQVRMNVEQDRFLPIRALLASLTGVMADRVIILVGRKLLLVYKVKLLLLIHFSSFLFDPIIHKNG